MWCGRVIRLANSAPPLPLPLVASLFDTYSGRAERERERERVREAGPGKYETPRGLRRRSGSALSLSFNFLKGP